MSKITDFAEGKACTARIPGVCNHNPTKSVWAHLRSVRWDSGTAKKPIDLIGLIACSDCHDAIDHRRRKDDKGEALDFEFVRLCAFEGHFESILILVKEGIIKT